MSAKGIRGVRGEFRGFGSTFQGLRAEYEGPAAVCGGCISPPRVLVCSCSYGLVAKPSIVWNFN